jgi:hypothetical protein
MIDVIEYRAHSGHERLDYTPYMPNGQNLLGPFREGADSRVVYRLVVLSIDNSFAAIVKWHGGFDEWGRPMGGVRINTKTFGGVC